MRIAILAAACSCWTGPSTPAAPPAIAASHHEASRAAIGQICDTADRIYVVDARRDGPEVTTERASNVPLAGTVTVIARPDGQRSKAAIDAGSVEVDECGGTAGGHAGCSESGGSRIRSSVLAGDELFLGSFRSFKLVHGDTYRTCRDADGDPWIALCSTRSWFAVAARGDANTAQLRIYRGRGVTGWQPEPPAVEERGTREGNRRFTSTRVTLVVDDASGFVELDGRREPCLALHVERTD